MVNKNQENNNPQIDLAATAEEIKYLSELTKPFPELKAKGEFFSTSKEAQKIRYVVSLILRDFLGLRSNQLEETKEHALTNSIKYKLGILDRLNVSSLDLANKTLGLEDPLVLAKDVAGQLLSVRREVTMTEPINFMITNLVSVHLGLPYIKEYEKMADSAASGMKDHILPNRGSNFIE